MFPSIEIATGIWENYTQQLYSYLYFTYGKSNLFLSFYTESLTDLLLSVVRSHEIHKDNTILFKNLILFKTILRV